MRRQSTATRSHQIIEDPVWGYKRLDPIPAVQELAEYYESRYCDLVAGGGRAPDLQRLIEGGKEAEEESAWLAATLYADVLTVLEGQLAGDCPRRLLDVGCGTGTFLAFMKEAGWTTIGLEPSRKAGDAARSRGLDVRATPLEAFATTWRSERHEPLTAISILNVLEHVPDPVRVLSLAKGLLEDPGGLLVVRVPNDFNALQLAAQRVLEKDPWWIVIPDHINYFDYRSHSSLLERLGFQIVHIQGDFPMELFLLMGEDYVGDPEVGRRCHERRRRFELALPADVRRRWYHALAAAELGRNCLIVATQRGT